MKNKLVFASVLTFLVLTIVVLLLPHTVIAKDSIQVNAFTVNVYQGNYDVWSWVPRIKFRANGPITSGSRLHVEFTQAGGSSPWLKFDCDTSETQKGYW